MPSPIAPTSRGIRTNMWMLELTPVASSSLLAAGGPENGFLRVLAVAAVIGVYGGLLYWAGRPGSANGKTIGAYAYLTRFVQPDGNPVTPRLMFALRLPALTFLGGWLWAVIGASLVQGYSPDEVSDPVALLIAVPPAACVLITVGALIAQAGLRRGHWSEHFPGWFTAGAELAVTDETGAWNPNIPGLPPLRRRKPKQTPTSPQ